MNLYGSGFELRYAYRFANTRPAFYYDKEIAYAEYVKRLNWKNPQKKTSIRRLSRQQKDQALIRFGKVGHWSPYISASSLT